MIQLNDLIEMGLIREVINIYIYSICEIYIYLGPW